MEKKNLKDKKKELLLKLKSNSKDAKFTTSLVGELLSIERQLSVEPTELFIKADEDEEVIDKGAYKFIKTDGVIIFSFNGYRSVLYPNLPAYVQLDYLFRLKEIIDKGTYEEIGQTKEDTEKLYEQALGILPLLFQMPTVASTRPNLSGAMINLLLFYMDKLAKSKKGAKAGDEEEDIVSVKDTQELLDKIKDSINI